jgi:hypothetical protein
MRHLKDSWQSLRTGLDECHKPIILEDESSAEAFTHNAKDSQLLEAVQHDPVTISNFTGVPPHMLGVKGYQSNSTLETQSQNLIDFTIDPWFIPWEEECNDKLLRESEKTAESHYFEFERKDLIRVDSEKRASMNRSALGGHPWKKISEVREDEGLDAEAETDFIPSPLNMHGGSSDAENSDPADGDADSDIYNLKAQVEELKGQLEAKSRKSRRAAGRKPTESRADNHAALQQLWQDTAGRMARRLATAKSRNVAADKAVLLSEHGETLRSAFGPLCQLTNRDAGVITERLCESIGQGMDVDQSVAMALADKSVG